MIIDCVRTIIILGTEGYYPDLDYATFIVKIISTFAAFTLISEIHIVLSEYVGYSQRYQSLFRYYLIVIMLAFSGASAILHYTTTPVGPYEFYLYQLEPFLYFIIFIAYVPVAVVLFFRNLFILRTVTNSKTQLKLIIFTILTVFLVGERGYTLGAYGLAESWVGITTELSLFLDILALTVISALFLIIIVGIPDLMESIGTFFSIKKLYVLKNNGILLFEYDFKEKKLYDGITSSATLIGGFVYAVSEGFKEVLKSEEDINEFSSGNRSVIIRGGNFILCVLIVTEDSRLLHKKLIEFTKIFETHYKDALEHWTGEFSLFNPNLVENWIFKYLREV